MLLAGVLFDHPSFDQKAQVIVSHYPILEKRWVTIALRAVSTLHAQGTYLVWRPDTTIEVLYIYIYTIYIYTNI